MIDDYNRAQISMNLTDYKVSPPHEILEAAREEARKRGIAITGSEIVGVIPFAALRESARFYLRRMQKSTGLPIPDLMETAIQSMGLSLLALAVFQYPFGIQAVIGVIGSIGVSINADVQQRLRQFDHLCF